MKLNILSKLSIDELTFVIDECQKEIDKRPQVGDKEVKEPTSFKKVPAGISQPTVDNTTVPPKPEIDVPF